MPDSASQLTKVNFHEKYAAVQTFWANLHFFTFWKFSEVVLSNSFPVFLKIFQSFYLDILLSHLTLTY